MLQDRPKGFILLVTLIIIVKILSSSHAGVINGSSLLAASTETSQLSHFDGAGIKMGTMLLPVDRARSEITLKESGEKTENHISVNFEIVKTNAGDDIKIDGHDTAFITKSDSAPKISKNVTIYTKEAPELISNISLKKEPLNLQGKNSSMSLDDGTKMAQNEPTVVGKSLQTTHTVAGLERSISKTTEPTSYIPNILADIIKLNHSHSIRYKEEIYDDIFANNSATYSEHVKQTTTTRNTIAMSLPELIMNKSEKVFGNAATSLKKQEYHAANNSLIKTAPKNELEKSNEINPTTSKTSTAKRAKVINDNSTNTNQLNLPDASEVWTLVGMKAVPLKHTTVLPESNIEEVGETNSGRNINNSISSSNSDKNLLDWTQIMINEDLDVKNLDNLIKINDSNHVELELEHDVDNLRSKEILSLIHTNKTTVTLPENSFVKNLTFTNGNTKLTALLAPVTATTLYTLDFLGTVPKSLNSSTANEVDYISPGYEPNLVPLTSFAPNLSFTTTVTLIEKKESDKSDNKASLFGSTDVSVKTTSNMPIHIPSHPTVSPLTQSPTTLSPTTPSLTTPSLTTPSPTASSQTTASPTSLSPSINMKPTREKSNRVKAIESDTSTQLKETSNIELETKNKAPAVVSFETTFSPMPMSPTTASPATESPTTAAYNLISSTYHLSSAPTRQSFGPHATMFPPSLSVDNENKASLIAFQNYDESAHENNINLDTTTQLPLFVPSIVYDTTDIELETTTTTATNVTEINSYLESPMQSTANVERATLEKPNILSESVRKQPLPDNFSTSEQPPPANRNNDNNNEVTLKTINNYDSNYNEHANVNVVEKEATLVLFNSVSTTVSSGSKAGAVKIEAPTENFDLGATTTNSRVDVDFGTSEATEGFPTISSTVEELSKTEIGMTQTTSSEKPLFFSTTKSTLFQDSQSTTTVLSSQLNETTTIFSHLPTANSKNELVTQIYTEGKQNKTLMNSYDMNSIYPLEKNVSSKGNEPTQFTEGNQTVLGKDESNDVELLPLTSTTETPTKETFTISTTTEVPLISLLDDYTSPVIITQGTLDENKKLATNKTLVVTMREETTTIIANPPAVTTLPKIYEVSATSISSTMLPITLETSNNAGGMDGSHLHPGSVDAPEMDVNVIIAISISVIGIVALILLVSFLYMVRKRQKQMSYGHRCRPVSLDAYSMDNVSVYNSVRRKGAMRSSKRSYGNAAFDDPSLTHNVLNAMELAKFIERRSAIFEEFKYVPQIIARPDEVPQGCEEKNRYANVIPIPETRVSLQQQNDNERSEYINANYVRGPKDSPNYYIACQAPLESTVTDFWRMIWEQNSRVIIQATDLVENGIEKCAEYLPPSATLDNHTTYGDFQVTLKNREVKDKYAISIILLKNTASAAHSSRELTHYWYKWPEAGVPNEEAPIIAMLLEVRSSLKSYAVEQANDIKQTTQTTQKTITKPDSRTEIENDGKKQPPVISLEDVSENNEKSAVSDSKNEININLSREKLKTGSIYPGPLTVHCSPGTGRSGTIIACDIAIRSLETQKRCVDVPQIVYYVRRGRASAVQTKEQYEFIYKIAYMYASKITNVSTDN